MIEKLLTLLKNLDFKHIITELKRLRKGAAVLILFICLCCGISDYILRKHGMALDWFTQIYLIIGFLSACVYGVKIFNSIADKVDVRKAREEKCRRLKPWLDRMSSEETHILKKFAEDNLCKTVFSDEYLSKISHDMNVINRIFCRFKSFGYTIKQCAHSPEFIFEIDKEFLEILKIYFKN